MDYTKHDELAKILHLKEARWRGLGLSNTNEETTVARERALTELEIARSALQRERDALIAKAEGADTPGQHETDKT